MWSDRSNLLSPPMILDFQTYLPDDIMVKVDRASMGVGLEGRAPLLDHRVIEFAWTLPMSLRVQAGQGKWILRQVLDRYVPRALIERPKMGFGVPIASWLRGPLREWAEELLDERKLEAEGYLEAAIVRQRWAEHLSGKVDWQAFLWAVLMFESWLLVRNAENPSYEPVAAGVNFG
jgi:asparagine synthase (glutamine-hydrolysing)